MKRIISILITVSLICLLSVIVVAEPLGPVVVEDDNFPAIFNEQDARQYDYTFDKPIYEKTDLINKNIQFYNSLNRLNPTAFVSGLGYKVTTGDTNVYSSPGGGTNLGIISFKERVEVISQSGAYYYIRFKNSKQINTTGYVVNTNIYVPPYGFTKPISSGSVIQYYGYDGHSGVDVTAPSGTTVSAIGSGTVNYRYTTKLTDDGEIYFADYGKHAILTTTANGNSINVIYGHLSTYGTGATTNPSYPSTGYPDEIIGTKTTYSNGSNSASAGTKVGGVGTTGLSTGNHLHFEIRSGTVIKDPFEYIVFPNIGWNIG